MKEKILLTGGNKTIIDEFFFQFSDRFDCFTTSLRYEDIMHHIKALEPTLFVYCMNNELRESISQMVAIKHRNPNLPIVIIGDPEDCDEFSRIAVNTAALILQKPLTANAIDEKISRFLLERKIAEKNKPIPELEYHSSKKHILVIDDDTLMLKLLKDYLRDDYEVATAINGKLAYKFLEKRPTDLILLDYAMPDEDGPTVLSNLRANPASQNIPVIFLTGITDKDKIQKALSLKPQGYLLKPVDREKLLENIKSLI